MDLKALFVLQFVFNVMASMDDILERFVNAEDFFAKDDEISQLASTIAERYFVRPQYIPLITAYGKKARRCTVDDESIFQEVSNYLVNYVSDFSCLSVICDADIKRKIACENFILITDSAENLQANLDLIPDDYFNYSGRIVIVVKTTSDSVEYNLSIVQDILDVCWALKMVNVLVLKRIDDAIRLYTYFPYNENSCGKSEMYLLNIWSNGSLESDVHLYPTKTLQMHGCLVRVTTVPRYPHVINTKHPNGTITTKGIEGNLVWTLAELLNFTLAFREPQDGMFWGRWNGYRWTGATGDLVYNRADLGIGAYYPSLMRFGILDLSYGYDTIKIVWTIPRQENTPSALKLLLPFTGIVWFSTICTLGLLMVLLYFLRLKIKNSTLKVKQLVLSIWQVTLGLGLKYMPPGRFVCYVFAVWIWTSMVLRNIYQGSLVSCLTRIRYDSSLKNMRDLLDADFEFFSTTAGMDIIKNVTDSKEVSEIRKNIHVIETDEEFDNITLHVARGDVLGALLHFKTRVPELNFKFEGQGMILALEQVYRTQILCMAFVKFGPLREAVNQYIHRLSEAGFLDKWVDDYAWPEVYEKDEPIILTMHHVVGLFFLLMIGELLSILVFICEVFMEKRINDKIIQQKMSNKEFYVS